MKKLLLLILLLPTLQSIHPLTEETLKSMFLWGMLPTAGMILGGSRGVNIMTCYTDNSTDTLIAGSTVALILGSCCAGLAYLKSSDAYFADGKKLMEDRRLALVNRKATEEDLMTGILEGPLNHTGLPVMTAVRELEAYKKRLFLAQKYLDIAQSNPELSTPGRNLTHQGYSLINDCNDKAEILRKSKHHQVEATNFAQGFEVGRYDILYYTNKAQQDPQIDTVA